MANLEGKYWLVEVSTNLVTPSYTVVGCQQSATFDMSGNTIEANCKQSGAWSDSAVSTKSWTMSLDAYVDFTHTMGMTEFNGFFVNDTSFLIRLKPVDSAGDPLTGGQYIGGTAIVTSVSANGPSDDFSTYTVSIQGKGAPTFTNI